MGCSFAAGASSVLALVRFPFLLAENTLSAPSFFTVFTAVSYTHLDVYKRQPLGWSAKTDMCMLANPLETTSHYDTTQKQTVEMRSPDGSACLLYTSHVSMFIVVANIIQIVDNL